MSDDMSMGLPSSAGEHGVLRSMQEVAMSSQEASKMLRTYNIGVLTILPGGAITTMTLTSWATSACARTRTSRKLASISRS